MKNLYLSCICLIMTVMDIEAQNERATKDYDFSPQVYSMATTSMIQPNLNTGTLSLNIPLFNWKDPDFSIPISLSYSTNGFKPNSPIGSVGLGWSLNVSGVISRQIVAEDDFATRGYNNASSNYNNDEIYRLEPDFSFWDDCTYPIHDNKETAPDIFHFNFANHSGTFILNEDKEFVAYNTDGEAGTYKIDYITQGSSHHFTIETADGYTYYFGLSHTSLEKLYNSNPIYYTLPGINNASVDKTQIIAWHLDRIVAPNGRIVDLNYQSHSSYLGIPLNTESNRDDVSTTFSQGLNIINDITRYKYASMTTVCYLKSITVRENVNSSPATIVDFDYSYRLYDEVDSSDDYDYKKLVVRQKKTDKITFYDHSGNELCNAQFRYTYKNSRMLLDAVNVSNAGEWNMEYNDITLNTMPGLLSNATDFWGYYNGRHDVDDSHFAPTRIDVNYNEYIEDDYKNPNFRYSRTGTLKKITYPTGGFSEFEYEANTAKYILMKQSTSSYITPYAFPEFELDSLPSISGPVNFLEPFLASPKYFEAAGLDECGGVRIKRISEHDGQKYVFRKTFSYNRPGTNESSGIVLEFNRYFAGLKDNAVPYFDPDVKFPAYNLSRSHIAYSYVTEKYPDGSYVVHRFTDYFDHPDEYSPYKKYVGYPYLTDSQAFANFMDNVQREADSRYYRRGLIKSQEWYSDSDLLKRKKEYEYKDSDSSYVSYVIFAGKYYRSARRFLCDYQLTMEKDIIYDGEELLTVKSYEYNDLGQIRKATLSDSTGNIVRSTYYRYCHENTAAGMSPLKAPISDILTTSTLFGNEYVVSNIKYLYDSTQKNSNPISKTIYDITGNLTKGSAISFNNIFELGRNTSNTVINYIYDDNHRLMQENYPGNSYVKYVWDDPKNNIVKIEVNDSGNYHLYEWKDMVGITKHTFPSRHFETYSYDDKNRLEYIFDSYGSPIKKYDYFLVNE